MCLQARKVKLHSRESSQFWESDELNVLSAHHRAVRARLQQSRLAVVCSQRPSGPPAAPGRPLLQCQHGFRSTHLNRHCGADRHSYRFHRRSADRAARPAGLGVFCSSCSSEATNCMKREGQQLISWTLVPHKDVHPAPTSLADASAALMPTLAA